MVSWPVLLLLGAAGRVGQACETRHVSGHTRMPKSMCLYRGPGARAETIIGTCAYC